MVVVNSEPVWWEILLPWLDAIAFAADGVAWTGFAPAHSVIDLSDTEGPVMVRSMSGGHEEGAGFRRTLAACSEYLLDAALITPAQPGRMDWTLFAPLLRPLHPKALPRDGASLPLESRWSVEWRTDTGPLVHTGGEIGRGSDAVRLRGTNDSNRAWTLSKEGRQGQYTACHEPAARKRVQASFTLVQGGRYTIRVTGDGFFDYWMLDPAHTPAPLHFGEERVEVGCGWGFVRLERGRETTYGALRRDWGL